MTDNPKLWRDMTREEKGALLLAHHEGKVVEWLVTVINHEGEELGKIWEKCSCVGYCEESFYRVCSEPVRETVTLNSWGTMNQWLRDGDLSKVHDSHGKWCITFDLIDGEPDVSSIRMRRL